MNTHYLMLKDIPVLKMDMDEPSYRVLRPELLPVYLRDVVEDTPDAGDMKKWTKAWEKDRDRLQSFYTRKILNLTRSNAKKILNAFNYSQGDDPDTKAKIAIACRLVSMNDSYWLNDGDLSLKWDDINIRKNHLNEVVAHIALTGDSLTATGEMHTPELTGDGAYAKAWIRETDGETYLYKRGSDRNKIDESRIEVEVSNILDHTNVPHVKYEDGEYKARGSQFYVCKCRNMADEELSIVTAEDVIANCNIRGTSYDDFVKGLDPENYYKMMVVDYLVANPDRHGRNWGFYMSNETGAIVSLHPLFDHNNAFAEDLLAKEEGGPSLIISNKTQKEAAQYALKRCSFKITGEMDRSLFLNEAHYESFMSKACSLGIYERESLGFLDRIKKHADHEYVLRDQFRGSREDMRTAERQMKELIQGNIEKSSAALQKHASDVAFAAMSPDERAARAVAEYKIPEREPAIKAKDGHDNYGE